MKEIHRNEQSHIDSLYFIMFRNIQIYMFTYFVFSTFLQIVKSQRSCKCGLRNGSGSIRNRIIGGRQTSQHPWQAGLLSAQAGTHFCGGTIISSRYVLSAAHCTYGWMPQGIVVRVGSTDVMSGGFTLKVQTIINHNRYRFHQGPWGVAPIANDISLLQLARQITFSQRILPICLPQDGVNYPISTKAVAVGWGKTSPGPMGASSRYLLETSLTIAGYSMCCIKTMDYHTGACSGDSGGPLMVIQNGK